MKFQDYLNESVGAYKTEIKDGDLIEMIKANCKKYLSDKNRKMIYRGMNGKTSYLCDTSYTKRKSANTSNVYTVILDDTLPSEFPRRSQSIICTTSYDYASKYGDTFVILPCDNAKIGCTNQSDIWLAKYANKSFDLYNLAEMFPRNTKIDTIEDFATFIFDKYFSDIVEADKHKATPIYPFFASAIKLYNTDGSFPENISDSDFKSLMISEIVKNIKKDMSAKELVFNTIALNDTSTIPENTEIWIGGKSIAVPIRVWEDTLEDIL